MPNDNQPPVTPTPPPYVPPTMNGVPSPPAPGGVPAPTPSPTPAPATPTPPTSTPPPAPVQKKSPLPIIIIILLILILIGGGIWYFVTQRPKNLTNQTDTKNSPTTTSEVKTATKNDCGAVLVNRNNDAPDMGKSIALEDWPKGADFNNSGDQDSVTEFCELKALKARAEEYIASLSENNFDKAYTYLTASETKAVPLAKKKADWTAEYGPYNFDPKNNYASTNDNPSAYPSYGIEPCLKTVADGWTKNMKNGFYRTAILDLDKTDGVSTTIALAMVRESDTWKISGENNSLHNAKKIVVDADPFANAQGDREFYNPYKCGE